MGLDGIFQVVFQCGEKVDAREAFHLVDAFGIVAEPLVSGLVVEHEADGLPFAVDTTQKNLEKGVGDSHIVSADDLGIVGHEGTACDIEVAVFLGPDACLFLQHLPVAIVKVVVLRADVGEVE